MKRVSTGAVPQAMRPTYEALVALTDAFCAEHLNEEYAEVCRQMAAALCRKRPSPLQSGPLQSWAGGIVHLVGSINFLFDRASQPYLSAAEIAAGFGVAKSTTGNKAAQIRQALKIRDLDWHWAHAEYARRLPRSLVHRARRLHYRRTPGAPRDSRGSFSKGLHSISAEPIDKLIGDSAFSYSPLINSFAFRSSDHARKNQQL